MGRRALAGTEDGYRPCARCRHARLRHTDHGKGPCSASRPVRDRAKDGTTTLGLERCDCPGFTFTEGLF